MGPHPQPQRGRARPRRLGLRARATAEPPAAEQQPRDRAAYTRRRMTSNAEAWSDPDTPNTGLVSVTPRSDIVGCAACCVSDLRAATMTRLVATTVEDLPKALRVARRVAWAADQRVQEQEKGGGKALVFQPVRVLGDLVAPPHMPEGAVALFCYLISSANPVLAAVLEQRAAAQAAQQAAGPGARRDNLLFFTARSKASDIAHMLASNVEEHGWSEVVCVSGGPLAQNNNVVRATEAIAKARTLLHAGPRQDLAVVVLPSEQQQHQAEAAKRAATVQAISQDSGLEGEARAQLPPLRWSLLVVRCAKNRPASLQAA